MLETIRFHARRVAANLLLNPRVVGFPPFRKWVHSRITRKVQLVESAQLPPRQLTLENTSICNARCAMCPYPTMQREKIIMPLDLFEKGLRDAQELGIQWVQPQFFGEPLVDKQLADRIRAAKALGLHVSIFSNGSLLTAEKAQILIDTGLDELKLSIDSHKPDVYEAIRKNLKFQTVLDNVRNIMALKRQLGATKPVVWVMMVEFEANHPEVREYYRFWSQIVDRVNISRSHNWAGQVTIKGMTILDNQSLRFPCPSPWDQLVVNAQGEILPCCCDYEGKSLSLGNLRDITLRQAWEGEKMAHIRRMHLERRFSELPLCDTCRPNDLWL